MKRMFAFVVAVALFLPVTVPVSQADLVTGPPIPERDREVPVEDEGIATYVTAGSVVAGVVGLSFGALYFIRKRNGK